MAVRVAINGFGRIGRNVYRAQMGNPDIDVVAINDITDRNTLRHLLKHDSVLGNLDADVAVTEEGLRVDDDEFKVFFGARPCPDPVGVRRR